MFRKKAIDDIRQETITSIQICLSQFESMVLRAIASGEEPNEKLILQVRENFALLIDKAKAESDAGLIEELTSQAETQSQMRAYACPETEIVQEGLGYISVIEEYNIPREIISHLKASLGERLKSADKKIARSALFTIYEEFDSWDAYTDDFQNAMELATYWLFGVTILSLIVAIFVIQFDWSVLFGIMFAGAAGSCVSVLAKMPLTDDVSLAGDLASYGRRIFARVGTGIVASWIGSAFLGWGILPIAVQGKSFQDVLTAGATGVEQSSSVLHTLIIIGVAMLLGFSERAITTFETHILGTPKYDKHGKKKN